MQVASWESHAQHTKSFETVEVSFWTVDSLFLAVFPIAITGGESEDLTSIEQKGCK